MSLINEALKKAQRQRTDAGTTPPAAVAAEPGTAAAPVARIAKHRPPLPARTMVILIGGGGSLLLMSGVFVFIFFLSGLDGEPEPAPRARVVGAPSPVPAAPSTDPVPPPAVAVQFPPIVSAPSPVSPPSSVLSPPSSASVSPPTSVLSPPTSASVSPPSSVLSPPPSASVSPPPSVPSSVPANPDGNPLVHEFLEKLRVTGIRASDTDPKVIMNDRIYRLNEIVDRATQLRLTRVETSALTFIDATGFEYRKNL
jgi:hypothetical protein